MEIKLQCECGQHFEFEVEPENGRMPVPVQCPGCGLDATPAADQKIAANSPTPGIALPPPPNSAPSNMTAPSGSAGIRLATSATTGTGSPQVAGPFPVKLAPPAFTTSNTIPKRTSSYVPSHTPGEMRASENQNSLLKGILGAFIGAVIGSGLLFGLWMMIGFRIPFTGTVIGALTGLMAKVFYRGTDSTLGAIAAAISVAVVALMLFLLGGQIALISGLITLVFAGVFAWKVAS